MFVVLYLICNLFALRQGIPESEYLRACLSDEFGWTMAPRRRIILGRAPAHVEDISLDVTLFSSKRIPKMWPII